ncbi:MAG TPA: NFACT RNA binding domain-containing protein [Candidatus Bilamarchaeum sp.]|nr:NFACT RNA binding domain-containing protein [Candidatus Bilamarchaeum sp.]
MRIKLFYERSVHDNAAYYYGLAKESREKIEGAKKAMKETEKEMEQAKKTEKKDVRVKRQKEWFEKFHFAYTAGGRLMLGGRSAQQNDFLVSKHMDERDLFFHADIQGGAVVVLKDGLAAGEDELPEAAQFAASFSNAWKNGNAGVDVYCVKKDQLTKNVSGGFVPAGAFAILGERKWFRSTALALRIGLGEKGIEILPDISKKPLKDELVIIPSAAGKDKGALAKSLAKRFSLHPDDFLELLPNGRSKTVQR